LPRRLAKVSDRCPAALAGGTLFKIVVIGSSCCP
jgi:hypothetical protein